MSSFTENMLISESYSRPAEDAPLALAPAVLLALLPESLLDDHSLRAGGSRTHSPPSPTCSTWKAAFSFLRVAPGGHRRCTLGRRPTSSLRFMISALSFLTSRMATRNCAILKVLLAQPCHNVPRARLPTCLFQMAAAVVDVMPPDYCCSSPMRTPKHNSWQI